MFFLVAVLMGLGLAAFVWAVIKRSFSATTWALAALTSALLVLLAWSVS